MYRTEPTTKKWKTEKLKSKKQIWVSVCSSVCLSRRSRAVAACGWFAAEHGRVPQISIDTAGARSAATGKKGKGSPYSITERRVPELIPVLGSQPAGDVSHKLGGKLPLLSARPAVTAATLKRAATNFAAL